MEKLCEAADKHERHMQYPDIVYLYFNVDNQLTVIELSCVGTEHTGAREMEIRKSDAIILTYAMYNPHSFHELANVTDDFKMRKRDPPVILVCNEDELIEEDTLSMADQSSTSEGYESDSPGQIKRHPSIEKIRRSQEDAFITKEQGQAFSQQLGNDSKFLSVQISQFDGTLELLMELLRKLNSGKSVTRRRRSTVVEGLKQIALPFQKSKKNREREESNSSTSSDTNSPDSSPSHSPSTEQPSPQSNASSVPQIEVLEPVEETVFPATKSEPIVSQKSRSLFKRNQVQHGVDSPRQTAQNSTACSIM